MGFQFNKHYGMAGKHAIFGASKPAWLNYDKEKIINAYYNSDAAERGTRLHALAAECIDLGVKQAKSKKTFCNYVNDAIGFRMKPEVLLYVNENFFGTADAIIYENGMLRIHDLKTGTGPVHPEQLRIYAAYFCIEYKIKPEEISFELRIYQNDEIAVDIPDPAEIRKIMDKVKEVDTIIRNLKEA